MKDLNASILHCENVHCASAYARLVVAEKKGVIIFLSEGEHVDAMPVSPSCQESNPWPSSWAATKETRDPSTSVNET